MAHFSDTAAALTALNATVEIVGPSSTRTVLLEDFFAGPDRDLAKETVLEAGEIVILVRIPEHSSREVRGVATLPMVLYLRAWERESGDFALVRVAAVLAPMDRRHLLALKR